MNEQEQFLKDLESDQNRGTDILDTPLTPEAPKEGDEAKGDAGDQQQKGKTEDDDGDFGGDDLKPKTRRERRLMRKLSDERESSIFLAGKLEARTEASKAFSEESDYLKGVESIYGTETPEAKLATDLLKKAIVGARDDAKRSALEEMKAERVREAEDIRKAQSELDGFIEEIEDTYDISLTDAQEKSYFELLKKMSPKKDGVVTQYADPHAVWEIFQDKLKSRGTDTRAKDLSARSMTQSGASKDSTLQGDAAARYLSENGII